MDELFLYTYVHVTFHDKTMHIMPTTDSELRPPLPTTIFELDGCKTLKWEWQAMLRWKRTRKLKFLKPIST